MTHIAHTIAHACHLHSVIISVLTKHGCLQVLFVAGQVYEGDDFGGLPTYPDPVQGTVFGAVHHLALAVET